ncbi:MAG: indolepyruvate oxidoreductase subunit beta [Bacillota bacterium]|nr:indolepyruvate oxidoreductase subunit beta [Thermanaerosceptrum fracticalcis]
MKLDIVIAGVGGQGNILASEVLAQCAMDKGYNVLSTETKGAAQRGGSVVSHLRISDSDIYAPLVPVGQADILLGFEPLEAMRNAKLLNSKGKFIINQEPVQTVLSNMGADVYPPLSELEAAVKAVCPHGYFVNATQAAKELGSTLLTNVIMLGAFSKVTDIFTPEVILAKLLSLVNEKFHEDDKAAFAAGQKLV